LYELTELCPCQHCDTFTSSLILSRLTAGRLACRTVDEVLAKLLDSSGTVYGPDPRKIEENRVGHVTVDTWEDLRGWVKMPFNVTKTTVHGKRVALGCSGDFTLMHRDAIHHMRGYPELPFHMILDDTIMMYAVNMGLNLVSVLSVVVITICL
jgi:hypothetical protein